LAADKQYQHAAGSLAFVSDPDWGPRRRSRQRILIVGCHAGGEVGLVVLAGVAAPAGASAFEVMDRFRADDTLRRLLLREPRGSVAQHANVVVPSNREDCEAGFVIMEPTEYPAMSGSNTMCVATVLLETGIIPMRSPVTRLQLEAPGGPVVVEASCQDGRVSQVTLHNVPSFADQLGAPLELAGNGTITVDVAYGGMWYAIVDAEALGFLVAIFDNAEADVIVRAELFLIVEHRHGVGPHDCAGGGFLHHGGLRDGGHGTGLLCLQRQWTRDAGS